MISKTITKSLLLAAMITVPFMASVGIARADAPGAEPVAGFEMQDGVWAVMAGSSLKTTIEGWSRVSNWNVVWDNPVDYRIRASATFYGDFEEAVGRLVDAIHQNNPNLSVTLYRGNRVVHVEDMPLTSN